MNDGLTISISKDFRDWEDFLVREDCGNIFQSSVMIPAYSDELKFEAYLVSSQLNGKIVGGMLIYRRFHPRLPIRLVNELHTSYGPVVCKELKKSIRNKIIESLLRTTECLANPGTIKHAFFVRSDFLSNEDGILESRNRIDIFEEANYGRVQNGYAQTFVIDLQQDPESLRNNFEKRTRWSLNKARRLNLEAVIDNTKGGLEKFYEMYADTAKRHGSLATPFGFLNRLYDILYHKDMMNIYLVYLHDIPISAAIVLNYKNTAYYYMSAGKKEYNYAQANTHLQSFIMTDVREKGIKKYDLLCAPSSYDTDNPQYGLYLFKRSFGGRSVPVFHRQRIFNKWLHASQDKLLRICRILS